MIHAGGRPHQCSLCQKTFIFKFDLNRHMKIHAERGFTCQLCSRSFLKQSSLDEHKPKCKGGAVSITNGTRPSLAQHSASSPSTFSPSKPDFPSLQIKSEPESPHRPLPCMPVPTIIPNLTKDDILRVSISKFIRSIVAHTACSPLLNHPLALSRAFFSLFLSLTLFLTLFFSRSRSLFHNTITHYIPDGSKRCGSIAIHNRLDHFALRCSIF